MINRLMKIVAIKCSSLLQHSNHYILSLPALECVCFKE